MGFYYRKVEVSTLAKEGNLAYRLENATFRFLVNSITQISFRTTCRLFRTIKQFWVFLMKEIS